jgi:hypothetical protein
MALPSTSVMQHNLSLAKHLAICLVMRHTEASSCILAWMSMLRELLAMRALLLVMA